MAVKVIIERQVEKGKEAELVQLLGELRARALMQPGYISGETLAALDDPSTRLVISTWHSAVDWKAWEGSAERAQLTSSIEQLLTTPSKTRIYTEV